VKRAGKPLLFNGGIPSEEDLNSLLFNTLFLEPWLKRTKNEGNDFKSFNKALRLIFG